MGFFTRMFGRDDAAKRDAASLYAKLMQQSRNPQFYGENRFPDSYDGRIDVLTLHIAIVLEALRSFDEQGQRLSQALFDQMKDDFEIALREEGISDAGVKKRIKPMIRLFYTRVKDYTESLPMDGIKSVAANLHEKDSFKMSSSFLDALQLYSVTFRQTLSDKTLGEIASSQFKFPDL